MKINIEEPTKDFTTHLTKLNNERILFSGPFGYGKTYFLTEYFRDNKEYKAFFLSPIKYIVGENEDIFEYIKIDIALSLLDVPEFISQSTLSFANDPNIKQYLRDKPKEVLNLLIDILNDLDISILKKGSSIIKNGIKARENYIKWKENKEKENTIDYEKLVNFSNSHNELKGSIFENDMITHIIKLVLQKIKSKTKKQNVLIIDDLDRLDPDHIFRLLNILSVHNNYVIDNDNKFGFDKIVVVCSISNIRKIYEHKYGTGVNFEGYIEKFYSSDIFHFKNQKAIAEYCKKEFSADLDNNNLYLLTTLLNFLVKSNKISIRSIIKHERISSFAKKKFIVIPLADLVTNVGKNLKHALDNSTGNVWEENYQEPFSDNTKEVVFYNTDFGVIKVIQILVSILGDYNNLIECLEGTRDKKFPNNALEFRSKDALSMLYSLTPLAHIAINNYAPQNVLFYSENASRNHPTYRSIISINVHGYPRSFQFGYASVKLNVGWNKENQYDSTKSFFSSLKIELIKEDTKLNISEIASMLLTIINYLHYKNLLSDFGISSDHD